MISDSGLFQFFRWQHLFTPIAIDEEPNGCFRALYFFGFRVCRWGESP